MAEVTEVIRYKDIFLSRKIVQLFLDTLRSNRIQLFSIEILNRIQFKSYYGCGMILSKSGSLYSQPQNPAATLPFRAAQGKVRASRRKVLNAKSPSNITHASHFTFTELVVEYDSTGRLPIITLPLPTSQEICQFPLQFSSTVGDFIDDLKFEDSAITSISITTTGIDTLCELYM